MENPSLRDFIEEYRKHNEEDVFEEWAEIDTEFEPTAYYEALSGANPLIWLRKLKGYPEYSLVTNTMGSAKRMAFALGVEERDVYRAWDRLLSSSAEPKLVNGNVPVKEVVNTGKAINLFDLPSPVHYADDGSIEGFRRYITGGLAIARDPANRETVNMSFTRIQPIGPDRYSFDMGSHGHLWKYVDAARKKSENLDVTVMIGVHPVFYMLAASFIENEYTHASALYGFDFFRGEKNDIPVPASAEILIEAEVLSGETFREGPFSEFTGYMSSRTTGNVARVKSIMRRKNPVFYDISPSNSHEHIGLFSIPRNAAIIRGVNTYLPPSGGYSIDWPFSGSHMVAVCGIANPEPGLSKQLGLSIAGIDALFTKIVMISEGADKAPPFENILLDLASSGLKYGENVITVPGVFTIKLDPASSSEGTNGKALLIARSSVKEFRMVENEEGVMHTGGMGCVLYSHEPSGTCMVNVVLDGDINLKSPDEVLWAIATRTKPDVGIKLVDGRLTIDTRLAAGVKVPKLPERVSRDVKERVSGGKG